LSLGGSGESSDRQNAQKEDDRGEAMRRHFKILPDERPLRRVVRRSLA
jgi:hypothetical protein